MPRIFVLNSNSSEAITRQLEKSVEPIRLAITAELAFGTLAGAPAGIETQADVEAVVLPTLARLRAEPADAYVIACFSDPGLTLAQAELDRPVVGMAEAAFGEAAALGGRFGVISILPASVARHRRSIRVLGLEFLCAGDRPLGIGVQGLGARDRVLARIAEVCRDLREIDGADCLVLGGAALSQYRNEVQEMTGLPVIDPIQAAVMRANSLIAFDYSPLPQRDSPGLLLPVRQNP